MKKQIYLSACIFFLIMFSMVVSSQADWIMYGGEYTPLWDGVSGDYYGRLNEGYSQVNTSTYVFNNVSSNAEYTPIVALQNLTGGELDTYMIIQNNQYLQILDEDLNLRTEKLTGQLVSTIDTLYFNDDFTKRDIAGIYRYNNTMVQVRVFSFNHTSDSLNETFSYNLTIDYSSISTAGLRHAGNTLYFVYDYPVKFVKMNSTDTTIVAIANQTTAPNPYKEPLAWTDMDVDGNVEYMTFNDRNLIVFREDGNIIYNYTCPAGTNRRIQDAKIYAPDSNVWKVVTFEDDSYYSSPTFYGNYYLISKKLDGSTLWSKTFNTNHPVGNAQGKAELSIVDDYDDDGRPDIYASLFSMYFTTYYVNHLKMWVFKGNDGTELAGTQYLDTGWGDDDGFMTLTNGDMNNNGVEDFVMGVGNRIMIYDPSTNETYINESIGSVNQVLFRCIPADINLDGFLEAVCSGSGTNPFSAILSSTAENSNPEIVSLVFDPSISIVVNSTLWITINAEDDDGDVIRYGGRCDDDLDWSNDSLSDMFSCSYDDVGVYNVTARVKDSYHDTYNIASYEVIVTQTGEVCDNDDVCESSQGENYINCPNDCEAPSTNYTQTEGGISIPNELVNTENYNEGFLPQIYFGTLAFFSGSLYPIIILVFFVLGVAIIITFFAIGKKLISKAFQ